MDYKKSSAETNTITRDLRSFESKTGNLYESLVVVSKRANQINQEVKEELTKIGRASCRERVCQYV